MENQDTIAAREFCIHHNIQVAFIHSLREYGLIETVVVEEQIFLPVSELKNLEKIIRLHFELDINLEGIQAIRHLLDRMGEMQDRIKHLTHRLKVYEPYPSQ